MIVIVGYILINDTVDQIIKPRLYGEGLDLSPLAVFLALFVFGFTLAAIGGLLAVPLLLFIRAFILQSSESTRWLANMLKVDRPHPQATTEQQWTTMRDTIERGNLEGGSLGRRYQDLVQGQLVQFDAEDFCKSGDISSHQSIADPSLRENEAGARRILFDLLSQIPDV